MKRRRLAGLTVGLLFSVLFAGSAYAGEWEQKDSQWVYRLDNGSYAKNGWQYLNGCWYYFDGNGYMQTGWIQDSTGNQYYLDSNGAMFTNAWIEGKYYVGSDGAMLKNITTPDGYYVMENGEWNGRPANEKGYYTMDEARIMVLDEYKSSSGTYDIFNGETGINDGCYEFVVRWQMSAEEMKRRLREGGDVAPNIYAGTVYFNIQTGEMRYDW